jgi:hypothetical protein
MKYRIGEEHSGLASQLSQGYISIKEYTKANSHLNKSLPM